MPLNLLNPVTADDGTVISSVDVTPPSIGDVARLVLLDVPYLDQRCRALCAVVTGLDPALVDKMTPADCERICAAI